MLLSRTYNMVFLLSKSVSTEFIGGTTSWVNLKCIVIAEMFLYDRTLESTLIMHHHYLY